MRSSGLIAADHLLIETGEACFERREALLERAHPQGQIAGIAAADRSGADRL
jgi:hypothetical protein